MTDDRYSRFLVKNFGAVIGIHDYFSLHSVTIIKDVMTYTKLYEPMPPCMYNPKSNYSEVEWEMKLARILIVQHLILNKDLVKLKML